MQAFMDSSEAAQAAEDLDNTPPPFKAGQILKETMEEQAKGWLKEFMTLSEMDKMFGRGCWRFVPRFLIVQSMRSRLIDDAK